MVSGGRSRNTAVRNDVLNATPAFRWGFFIPESRPMPDWIDAPTELATIIGIGATSIGVLFWIVRTKVNEVLHETKPNSGASLRDAVDRIEGHMVRIESKIDGHVSWHLEKE